MNLTYRKFPISGVPEEWGKKLIKKLLAFISNPKSY